MTDTDALNAGLLDAVPFAATLGLRLVAADPAAGRAVVRLPDSPALYNHVGGPHAGALFGLGETASGAVVLAVFAEQLSRAVPLTVRATVNYRRFARGTVTATATLARPAAEILAELDAGVRPEFPVDVEIATEDGTVTADLTVEWTLRPL
jgi:acyl-coenzyme A thioesterase PaaI-like protein